MQPILFAPDEVAPINLNLEYHKKQLVVLALNTCRLKIDAARALGISERSLYNYIIEYNIAIGSDLVYYVQPVITSQSADAA